MTGALADGNFYGLGTELKHVLGHQGIVQDDLRLAQNARTAHRDEIGGAGAGADQIYLAVLVRQINAAISSSRVNLDKRGKSHICCLVLTQIRARLKWLN